jgi:ribosomal protein S5
VGEGKSVEPDEGRKQSVMAAIRNMKPVPRYENRTIFGDLEHKVGATKVQLFARPPGTQLLNPLTSAGSPTDNSQASVSARST